MQGEAAGGQLGEAERGSRGRRRPASGSGAPPTALSVKAGGRWETGLCGGGSWSPS